MTRAEIAAYNLGVESIADLARAVAVVYRGRLEMLPLRRGLIVSVLEALAEASSEYLMPPDNDGGPAPAGGAPRPRPPAPHPDAVEMLAA